MAKKEEEEKAKEEGGKKQVRKEGKNVYEMLVLCWFYVGLIVNVPNVNNGWNSAQL